MLIFLTVNLSKYILKHNDKEFHSRLIVFESSGKHTCMIQHQIFFVTLKYLHFFTSASKDAEAEISK